MLEPNSPKSTKRSRRRILIFGCGYLGRVIGQNLQNEEDEVWGSTRSKENLHELQNLGIKPIVADWTDSRTLSELQTFTHVIIAVSRGRNSTLSYWDTLVGGLNNLLPRLSPTAHLTYVSSTGVYHQKNALWVDETSPTFPTRPSAQAHLAAECLIRRTLTKQSWAILRLAGIYGPKRIPNCNQLLHQVPIHTDPNTYLNLIHVEDAVQAVLGAMERSDQATYVISDDRPTRRGDYYSYVAKLLRAPEPVFHPIVTDETPRLRSEGNKRIWNRKMKRMLVPKLRYPTYKEGLRPLLSRDC